MKIVCRTGPARRLAAALGGGLVLLALCAGSFTGARADGLPSSTTITGGDNGATIAMNAGDRFLLKLGEDFDWAPIVGDLTVVSRVPNIAVVRGAQGIYQARQAGETDLTATRPARCPAGQSCPDLVATFSVHLVVTDPNVVTDSNLGPPPFPTCPELPSAADGAMCGATPQDST